MLKRDKNGTKIFPEHFRIRWKNTGYRAAADREVFKAWMVGKITTREATERIAKGNEVEMTEKQFIANAEWLGYIRRVK